MTQAGARRFPAQLQPCGPTFFLQSPQKTPRVAFISCIPQSMISKPEAAVSKENSVTFQATTLGGSSHKFH